MPSARKPPKPSNPAPHAPNPPPQPPKRPTCEKGAGAAARREARVGLRLCRQLRREAGRGDYSPAKLYYATSPQARGIIHPRGFGWSMGCYVPSSIFQTGPGPPLIPSALFKVQMGHIGLQPSKTLPSPPFLGVRGVCAPRAHGGGRPGWVVGPEVIFWGLVLEVFLRGLVPKGFGVGVFFCGLWGLRVESVSEGSHSVLGRAGTNGAGRILGGFEAVCFSLVPGEEGFSPNRPRLSSNANIPGGTGSAKNVHEPPLKAPNSNRAIRPHPHRQAAAAASAPLAPPARARC